MQIIRETLEGLKVGAPSTFERLTVFPLIGRPATEPSYATLDEALAEGWARVAEVSSSGSVPELCFVNEGDRAVFMLDGEELIGAKQNRVLNLTILAPAGQTLVIPVSCVEQGRWSEVSRHFASSKSSLHSRARRMKMQQVSLSMACGGPAMSDQGALWDEIDRCASEHGVSSRTHAMADIYDQHGARIEDYVGAFGAEEGQSGAVFALNGRLFGLDLFDHPATLRKLLSKVVRSYALDTLDAPAETAAEPPVEAVRDFVKELGRCRVELFKAVGNGDDVRLSGPRITGGGLVAEKRLVHLSAFRTDEAANGGHRGPTGRLLRASLRRHRQ